MSYNANIPLGTDFISQSSSQIRGNFQQINTQYGTSGDHVEFTAASGNGTHKQVSLSNVASPGAQVDPASVIYTKAAAGGIFPNVLPFFKNQTGELNLLPDLAQTGTNFSFTLGQMIFNFGTGQINTGSEFVITTWQRPFTTAIFSILLTKNGNGIGPSGNVVTMNANISGLGLTQCRMGAQTTLTSGNLPFYYLAIGF